MIILQFQAHQIQCLSITFQRRLYKPRNFATVETVWRYINDECCDSTVTEQCLAQKLRGKRKQFLWLRGIMERIHTNELVMKY